MSDEVVADAHAALAAEPVSPPPNSPQTDDEPDACGIRHAPIPGGIEVRDPDDEIVAHGAFVHVERLGDDRVWMSIKTPNGQEVHIDFFTLKRTGRDVRMSVTDQGDVPTDIPEPQA